MQTAELGQALNTAFRHHSAGQWQQAETLYQRILDSHPEQPQALHLLGLLAFHKGKKESAVELISKAVAIMPGNAEAQFHLGVALQSLDRLDAAAEHYRSALDIEPDNAQAHNNLGSVYEDLKRFDKAVASYHTAISVKPDYAGAHMNLGSIYRKHGQPTVAVAHYRKGLERQPEYAELHFNLGLALTDLARLDEAIACYGKALLIKPDYVIAHEYLGSALREQAQFSDAIECYRAALALDPGRVDVHVNLGITLHALELFDEAIEHYRSALALEPESVTARHNLAHTFWRLERYEEALEIFETLETPTAEARALYQGALIVTHRDRVCGPSGRREAAGDVVHRQGVPTPSDGPHTRPKRRLPRAFGQRRARLPMPGIGAAHAPCRKPWEDVSMSHYHRSLVLECLFALKDYNAFYERQKDGPSDRESNLRTAAINAFAANQLQRGNPDPFCKQPLEFIRVYDALESERDTAGYLDRLVGTLEQQAVVWEPFQKSTVSGFQTPAVLFENATGPLAELRGIIEANIERYRAETFPETCDFIDRFPERYSLNAWYGKLVKGGYRIPHIHPSGWLIPTSADNDSQRRLGKVFGKERAAKRCGVSGGVRDAVRKPCQAALRVAYAARRRASERLDDVPHRRRRPSYPTRRLRDLYGSLSTLVGISGVFYIHCPTSGDREEGAIEFSLWGYGYPILDEHYPRTRHHPKNGDLVLFPSSLFHGTIPIHTHEERLIVAFDLVPTVL